MKNIEKKSNLVLLVGTSPLPNYVVAKFFKEKRKIKKITLICSETNEKQYGTEKYAEIIKEAIDKEGREIEWSVVKLTNISNMEKIKEDLERNKVIKEEEKTYFNFTCGTKMMVMEVYRYLNEKKIGAIELSYLNAKTYRIHYVEKERGKEKTTEDLREEIEIDIDLLLKLHNYRKKEKKEKEKEELKKLEKANEVIEEMIKSGKIEILMNWWAKLRKIKYAKKVVEKTKDYKNYVENEPEGREWKKNFEEMPEECLKLINAMPKERRINKNKEKKLWIPEENTTNKEMEKRIKKTIEYLDGKWLEHYVYKEMKKEIKWTKEGKNIEWSIEAKKKGEIRTFEMDIGIIKGYQLIGISITSSKAMHLCKLKGFEVIHRVKQIGGEEGIAILITGLEKKESEMLQKDLEYETGTRKERFVVMGIAEWGNIGKKIKEIIEKK